MNAPTERDIKKLFGLSLNQCAFPNCITPIFELSGEMAGEICHIKARNPEGPRYDPNQTDAERHSFENLILLCRNHHKVVDDDPQKYIVEWLKRTRHEHEKNGNIEITQNDARLARRLLDSFLEMAKVESNRTTVNQIATGKNITQVAGDYHHHEKPPKPKIVVTPPAGAVSSTELKQIQSWIESLVENTVGMSRDRAFGMWRNRFKNRFGLIRSEQLLSTQLPEAEAWHR